MISLVGVDDNLIHETVYLDAENDDGTYNFEKMYANVKEDIQAADLAFINQETVLGGTELGLAGYPCFNSPTEITQNLKDTGFTFANIASNHTLDRFQAGIDATGKAFDDAGIVVYGAYYSQEQFDTIPVFEKKVWSSVSLPIHMAQMELNRWNDQAGLCTDRWFHYH